ncbi:ABC transporter substrate-binding protein [Leeia sp.]|uniref:ABC transporter substrate-binding protein n=1 Tax=Leeia sp. TaxID=2884678 RepID=UPI0035B413CF
MTFTPRLLAVACLTASFAQAATGISDNVVKIGVLTDMNGIYAQVGGKGTVAAAQMAIADFGGKVLGKPIQLVSADHRNEPEEAVRIAKGWMEGGEVDMVTDLMNSEVALEVQRYAATQRKITMTTGATTSQLTNRACTRYGIHYAMDAYALITTSIREASVDGADSWAILMVDYGKASPLTGDMLDGLALIKQSGGKFLGSVKHEPAQADMTGPLLEVQAKGAKELVLANAGGDFVNAMRQAKDFGLAEKGQEFIGVVVYESDIRALGLDAAQGMRYTTAFYWDMNPETRAWAQRFYKKFGSMPNQNQAGVYSAVTHYLNAVRDTGTDEADTVMAKMKSTPINDFFAKAGRIREDGRMIHDMYYVQVKRPSESKGDWDLLKVMRTIKGDRAFRPVEKSGCALLKQSS